MPHKECPKCSKKQGVRTKVCSCGHEFAIQSKNVSQDYVAGGLWRLYRTIKTHKDLPALELPPHIKSNKKLTIKQVQSYVAYEGVGDAVEFIPPHKIEDEELKKAWVECAKCMKKIRTIVYRKDRNDDSIYI